eukprot:6185984-Pleurochrysis_carterae.AAC.2
MELPNARRSETAVATLPRPSPIARAGNSFFVRIRSARAWDLARHTSSKAFKSVLCTPSAPTQPHAQLLSAFHLRARRAARSQSPLGADDACDVIVVGEGKHYAQRSLCPCDAMTHTNGHSGRHARACAHARATATIARTSTGAIAKLAHRHARACAQRARSPDTRKQQLFSDSCELGHAHTSTRPLALDNALPQELALSAHHRKQSTSVPT